MRAEVRRSLVLVLLMIALPWGVSLEWALSDDVGETEALDAQQPTRLVQGVPSQIEMTYFESNRPISIAFGGYHGCTLFDNGTVSCSGRNQHGELGRGFTSTQATELDGVHLPVDVRIASIHAGLKNSCAITSDHDLWCWGDNSRGQLGRDSSQSTDPTPSLVPTVAHLRFLDVAIGQDHLCGLTLNRTIECWGSNAQGQLGRPSSEMGSSHEPVTVDVPGHLIPEAISVGFGHSCALVDEGSIWCWGENSHGQLGRGYESNWEPVGQVLLPAGDVSVQVSSGYDSSCARLESGELWCWGANNYQQLSGTSSGSSEFHVPTHVGALPQPVVDFGVGSHHTCALLASGTLTCWGHRGNSAIGDGVTTNGNAPVTTVRLDASSSTFRTPSDLIVGPYQNCALFDHGGFGCWGYNGNGVLGLGHTSNRGTIVDHPIGRPIPSEEVRFWNGTRSGYLPFGDEVERFTIHPPLPTGLEFDPSSGSIHYDGSRTSHSLSHRIDLQSDGQSHSINLTVSIEDRRPSSREALHALGDIGLVSASDDPSLASLEAGDDHVCMTSASGRLQCWGESEFGRLGMSTSDLGVPTTPTHPDHQDVIQVASAELHTCTLSAIGMVHCFGEGEDFRISGGTDDSTNPREVPLGDHGGVLQLASGWSHSCVLLEDGSLRCWGANDHGQLGDGSTSDRGTPVAVQMPTGTRATSVMVGDGFSCALVANGTVMCWGRNEQGQLGDGTFLDRTLPSENHPVLHLADVEVLVAGKSHACASPSNGSVLCWGMNSVGQLGDGTLQRRSTPALAQGAQAHAVVSMDASRTHTCATRANGTMWCWGLNAEGQLGDGTTTFRSSPVRAFAQTGPAILKVTTGDGFTCITTSNHSLQCAGAGTVGQLGNGAFTSNISMQEVTTDRPRHRLTTFSGVPANHRITHSGIGHGEYALVSSIQGLELDAVSGVVRTSSDLPVGTSSFVVQRTSPVGTITRTFDLTVLPWVLEGDHVPAHAIDVTWGERPEDEIIVGVDAASRMGCVRSLAGTLQCWGWDAAGQVGDSTGFSSSVSNPTPVHQADMGHVITKASKGQDACAINVEHELWCWGLNSYGNAGRAGTSGIPRLVPAFEDRQIASVDVGEGLTCAIEATGEAWCWGRNHNGQLGQHPNGLSTSMTPVRVGSATEGAFTHVTAGSMVACFIHMNGSVACQGQAAFGALGDGSTTDRVGLHWVHLPSGRQAVALDAGHGHVCAILDDRSVACWGSNAQGQIGNNSTTDALTPQIVLPPGSEVVGLSLASSHSCAWNATGTAWCWGRNYYGQLGNGNTDRANQLTPTEVLAHQSSTGVRSLGRILDMSAGSESVCALYTDGLVSCWGMRAHHSLGDGVSGNTNGHDRLSAPSSKVIGHHGGMEPGPGWILPEGTSLNRTLRPMGWGLTVQSIANLPASMVFDRASGALHYDGTSIPARTITVRLQGPNGPLFLPIDVMSMPASSRHGVVDEPWSENLSIALPRGLHADGLEVGPSNACIWSDGDLRCWGSGSNYLSGSSSHQSTPTLMNWPEGESIESVSIGRTVACGLSTSGDPRCWGYMGSNGLESGSHSTGSHSSPRTFPRTGLDLYDLDLQKVSMGNQFGCGLTFDGQLMCWGSNGFGQLGRGGTSSWELIGQAHGPSTWGPILDVDTAVSHTCALSSAGELHCWGRNLNGAFGIGNTTDQVLPIRTPNPTGLHIEAFDTSDAHTCAIYSDASVRCWGDNTYGQLGDGTTTSRLSPTSVILGGTLAPVQISVGTDHSCLLFDDGSVSCWGSNSHGQLGVSTSTTSTASPLPSDLPLDVEMVQIGTGASTTCGLSGTGEVWCWGRNDVRQLGTGDATNRDAPTRVMGFEDGRVESHRMVQGMAETFDIGLAGSGATLTASNLTAGITMDASNRTLSVHPDAPVGSTVITVRATLPASTLSRDLALTVLPPIDAEPDRVTHHAFGLTWTEALESEPIADIVAGVSSMCLLRQDGTVGCMGNNNAGQLGIGTQNTAATPVNLQTPSNQATSISFGHQHACGLTEEGDAYCWGQNNHGQVGDGSASIRTIPRLITTSDNGLFGTRALQVQVGESHSCAIFEDVSTRCWGYNAFGQLGLGTLSNRNRPSLVTLPTDRYATDLALGMRHTCALLDNGSVMCWGDNEYGQLGDGTTTDSLTPTWTRFDASSTVIGLSAGEHQTCALLGNGSAACWGYGGNGRLGNGGTDNALLPVHVDLPQASRTVELSTRTGHTCALLENGTVYCWGLNANRQLGDGTTIDRTTPVHASTFGDHGIVHLASGSAYTCALTHRREIICVGSGTQPEGPAVYTPPEPRGRFVLGHASTKDLITNGWGNLTVTTSINATGVTLEASRVHIAPNASVGVMLDWAMADGSGRSLTGRMLFDGHRITTAQRQVESWVSDLKYLDASSDVPAHSIAMGRRHACTVLEDETARCWGANDVGQLGDGSTLNRDSPTPVRADGVPVLFKTVAPGWHYESCGIDVSDHLLCWGDGSQGQLGNGRQGTLQKVPQHVLVPWDKRPVQLGVGYEFACALFDAGDVQCWGENGYGQLGDGTNTDRSLPVEVGFEPGRFATQIDVGQHHACAILDDGSLVCWGRASDSRMGAGSVGSSVETPQRVLLPTDEAEFVAIGTMHGCAMLENGSVYCWGQNDHGEVGIGTTGSQPSPAFVDLGLYAPVVALDAGDEHTCALHADATLTCWGLNSYGQIGDGGSTDVLSPKQVGLDGAATPTSIALGRWGTCVTASDGLPQCWGSDLVSGDGQQRSTAGPIDLDRPTTSSVLTYVEGSTGVNTLSVSGWNVTFSVSPPLPSGFALDQATGSILANGSSTFGASRHDVTGTAGAYSTTVSINLVVIRDTDGDGVPDNEDFDDDDDGILDILDDCPLVSGTSSLGDLGCPDADLDGWGDHQDAFASDATQWNDSDGDGWGDNFANASWSDDRPEAWPGRFVQAAGRVDAFPLDRTQWLDTDGDGFGDNVYGTQGDACPMTAGASLNDVFGCPDADGDGWSDQGDAFPLNASQHSDRDGDGWGDNATEGAVLIDEFPSDGTQWTDRDGDGHGDNPYGTEGDWFPDDPAYWSDNDRDGVADELDAFPNEFTQSTDRDGDGYGDDLQGNRPDQFPDDATEWADVDGDGVGNNADAFPFDPTQQSDRDGDGYGDNLLGSGADLFPDDATQWEDHDGDGLGDNQSGNDPDPYLNDLDNDGFNDSIDILPRLSSPGDLDADGCPDEVDLFPDNARECYDNDRDGIGDNEDFDDDNDGWSDTDELRLGTDALNSAQQPVDSFEIVIPGTSVGLGAWDLIGMFGGIPLICWIAFGFATRNGRTAKFEGQLRAATSRDELEEVALRWEFSLMIRLLGPHQGIRLERLRAELDDHFEAQGQTLSSVQPAIVDQTHLISDVTMKPLVPIEAPSEVEVPAQDQPAQPAPAHPLASMAPTQVADGYEWLQLEGIDYYRTEGSGSEWVRYGT